LKIILFYLDIEENKEFAFISGTDYMQINIHVDAISCLLQDDHILRIRISLQRFDCQIQNFLTIKKALKTLIVNNKLGFVSIHDLSLFVQLYEERFFVQMVQILLYLLIEKILFQSLHQIFHHVYNFI